MYPPRPCCCSPRRSHSPLDGTRRTGKRPHPQVPLRRVSLYDRGEASLVAFRVFLWVVQLYPVEIHRFVSHVILVDELPPINVVLIVVFCRSVVECENGEASTAED